MAEDLGISATTLQRWLTTSLVSDATRPSRCWRCDPAPAAGAQYAYLLGQYLGDGHLVTDARTPVLRIYACTDYPGVADETAHAMRSIRGREPGRVYLRSSDRLATLQSYWMHWPCLFPQHGPGRKHLRPIVLTEWQREIVAAYPWPLIRGLIHSDGCRAINRVVVRGKAYIYPRYFFANESRDILAIMGTSLDQVGVQWRLNRPNSISIARRRSVELLEQHVGPKS